MIRHSTEPQSDQTAGCCNMLPSPHLMIGTKCKEHGQGWVMMKEMGPKPGYQYSGSKRGRQRGFEDSEST